MISRSCSRTSSSSNSRSSNSTSNSSRIQGEICGRGSSATCHNNRCSCFGVVALLIRSWGKAQNENNDDKKQIKTLRGAGDGS